MADVVPQHWPGALPAAWSPLSLEMHYAPLRCPDEHCTSLVCGHCTAGGMTRQHVSESLGRCSYGHLASDPAPILIARLTEWIKAEGVIGHYPPDQIAARVVAQVHPGYVITWLDQGGTDYLRDMCARVKDETDLSDAEFAAEQYRHGHGPY